MSSASNVEKCSCVGYFWDELHASMGEPSVIGEATSDLADEPLSQAEALTHLGRRLRSVALDDILAERLNFNNKTRLEPCALPRITTGI